MALADIFHNSVERALNILSENLAVSDTIFLDTHSVLEVTGWQDNACIDALAMYLVALRACVIDQAGRIITGLIGDTRDCAYDLLQSVNEIVEQPSHSNESIQDWKSKWRNPWIAEGIWHCCMRVAMDVPELHERGTIIALELPHISPKDHGLDVTALYVKEKAGLGMTIIETKAYRDDPNKAISDAVTMLMAIETGKHDTRLRQIVTSFRNVIDAAYKQQLSFSLWKNERTLIPNPHYEARTATVQWSRKRNSFSPLTAPVVIMPHAIDGYNAFFDKVANTMRSKGEDLAANV
jgi:hypothetical protein